MLLLQLYSLSGVKWIYQVALPFHCSLFVAFNARDVEIKAYIDLMFVLWRQQSAKNVEYKCKNQECEKVTSLSASTIIRFPQGLSH